VPVANYKVFQWGNPIGRGVTSSLYVAVSGVAKAASATLPATVVNELICADLARAIRLPVPPSFLVYNSSGDPYHVSLNFHLAGEDLPPADAAAVVSEHPDLACGIVLFDAWICNKDRHPGNLAYDKVTKRATVFDHSHCFLANGGKVGLEGLTGDLAIGKHCLAPYLIETSGFMSWRARIMAVPEFYIRDAVVQTVGIGPMTADIAGFAVDYLLDRRSHLASLVQANQGVFPNIKGQQWEAMKGG
jgi:HipA-like protein